MKLLGPMISIVDDDQLVREALLGLMKVAGFPALAFVSAEEFLNSGEQRHTGCLIVDFRLPGMSGLELQSKLKAERCKIRIIFVTAHGDAKMQLRAMRDGAVEFLTKPFDNAVLLETVQAAMRS